MDTQTSTYRQVKPVKRRRWLVGLIAVALILTILAWVAYQQRVALLVNSANAVLQPYGFHIETLAGLRLSTTSMHIRQLALLHSASRAPQSLHDLRIDFSAAGLMSARVDSIVINTAVITLPDDALTAPPAGTDPAGEPQSQLTDILAAIPFGELSIAHLRISGNDITTGATRIQDLSVDLKSLQASCQPIRCHIRSEFGLTLDKLSYRSGLRAVELDLITFGSDARIDVTLDGSTNTLSLAARSSTLTLPAIRVDNTLTGLVGSIHRLNLSQTLTEQGFDPQELTAHAEVTLSELYTNLVDVNVWPMRLDQHLTLQRGAVHMTGTLFRDNQRLLLNDLQHNITRGTGQGTLEVPHIDFDDSTNKLSDLVSPLPWQTDILSGSASAIARIDWLLDNNRPITTGTVQVSLDDLSGYFNEIAFLRLSTDFEADLLTDGRLRSSRTASVNLASLDAGIELTDIRSNYRIDLQAGSVSLTNASFSVFGGTVSSDQLDYHFQDNDSRFTIVMDSIDLSRVLGLSAYRGVSATGLVSGQLPVRLQGLTPSIRGGTLSALEPGGTIRYSTGASASGDSSSAGNPSVGNQSLDLVYQALEHYRFTLMETTVDYQESGELDLSIRMEGVSPELNDGQRINLNLNINDDVPALLQSLQAARSVTESIQTRLDARQTDTDRNPP